MNRLRTRVNTATSKGFTLIELLIVIVILGILAGIAIFAVAQFKSDATKACTNANNRIQSTGIAASSAGASAYTTGNSTC
jgi:general secretion pathway protein G